MEQVNDKTTKRQIHHHYKIKMFTDNYRIFTIQHKVKLSWWERQKTWKKHENRSNSFCLVIVLYSSGCLCIVVVGLVWKEPLNSFTIYLYLSCYYYYLANNNDKDKTNWSWAMFNFLFFVRRQSFGTALLQFVMREYYKGKRALEKGIWLMGCKCEGEMGRGKILNSMEDNT